MYSIVITIAISMLIIVAATLTFQREISSLECFVIILVVYVVTLMVQRALSRRRGRA